jgi:hypothetical protein
VAALNEARASERSVATGTIPQTNAQDQKTAFIAQARSRMPQNYLPSVKTAPISKFEIKAGWDIDATLEQSISSDQPGEISYVDTEIRHSGKASLRLEKFTANPAGNARAMQSLKVQPHRCYRLSVWVKTENLEPASAFRVQVLAGDRALAAGGTTQPGSVPTGSAYASTAR